MTKYIALEFIEYWVVRVVRDTKTCKTVVKEIEFATQPTEEDIVNILLTTSANEFISIAHNYKMDR